MCKEINIAKAPKYDGYQQDLLQWFINFLIKKTSASEIKNENISNKQLAEQKK